ncbi:hypothetical protein Nepgr_001182 [Nepenthes gracilis]|uniref:Uncharacterized protein n=1 Tax=Nepenthes gracilis TaxID=150966 RepID=A0AAD3RXD3_NEPGR|nr:hypothetical protein Nepgr_001182 [Nepenthes gracilis]
MSRLERQAVAASRQLGQEVDWRAICNRSGVEGTNGKVETNRSGGWQRATCAAAVKSNWTKGGERQMSSGGQQATWTNEEERKCRARGFKFEKSVGITLTEMVKSDGTIRYHFICCKCCRIEVL